MTIILIAFFAFLSTLTGGFLALRFHDKRHLVLGFSAGAVLGVAFFDLLPESMEFGRSFYSIASMSTVVALGFFIYLFLDRLVFFHGHSDHHEHQDEHKGRGILGAGSLVFHSMLDGAAIGFAFQISPSIGAVVATAVLVHDFSDGINTVNLILKNAGGKQMAVQWLFFDSIAPIVGVALTMFFTLPERFLGIVLALFTGFFLYIGASDLVPESHHSHPRFLTTFMTILGAGVLYVAIHFATV
jgi:zinc and cadmium transporter